MRSFIIAAAVAGGILLLQAHRPNGTPTPIPAAAPGMSETAPRPIKDNVVAYHTRDARMLAAKDEARRTLPTFVDRLTRRQPGTYAVKFPLTQNGATEHIWLQVDSHREGTFGGRLSNMPVNGQRYGMGDRMTVPMTEVEDWSITSQQGITGAYTARVILADMPAEKAAAMAIRFLD